MKIPKRKDASPFSFDFQQNTFLSVIHSNFHLQKTAKRHKRKRQRIKRGEKGKERERERLGRFSSFEGKRLFIAIRRTILEREGFPGEESVRSSRDLGGGEEGEFQPSSGHPGRNLDMKLIRGRSIHTESSMIAWNDDSASTRRKQWRESFGIKIGSKSTLVNLIIATNATNDPWIIPGNVFLFLANDRIDRLFRQTLIAEY